MFEVPLPARPDQQALNRLAHALGQSPAQPLFLRFSAHSEFADDHISAYLQPETELRRWADVARRLETREAGAVAYLEQDVTGVWFELALACRQRLIAGLEVRFLFPAIRFGLIPALGGGQRLVRLLPAADAVSILLRGEPLRGERAVQLGFAQTITGMELSTPAQWLPAAQPWDRAASAGQAPGSAPGTRQALNAAFLALRSRTPPQEQAPTALLHALYEGSERTFEAGVSFEQAAFFQTRETPSTRNRVRLFADAATKAKAQAARARHSRPPTVGVIGAGLMGTGIAYTAARAGSKVFLVDESPEALERSHGRIRKLVQTEAPEGGDSAHIRLLGQIHPSLDLQTLSSADVVIEAVFERLEVKMEVLRETARLLHPGAILASNTTTLPITRLARFVAEPSRFVGMHFFAPVQRMELLEIVCGPQTSREAIDRALGLAAWVGKTPVVVNDGPGFFTSRVVMAYVQEALLLVEEGVDPFLIDHVAMNAGMIIGPLGMADLTSLDLLRDIYKSLAQEGRGAARHAAHTAGVLEQFISRGRLGKKVHAGLYDYDAGGSPQPWPGLDGLFPPAAATPEFIRQRLFCIQSLEAVHACREGVISDPDLGDLAAVLGWNYPAHLGGPFAYIKRFGQDAFAATCQELAENCGERFQMTAPTSPAAALPTFS
ncbi:MAG: hypothetical protein JO069_12965 [Verrucomicrobia bacterium]|nr:hypothetical protein [Verrucomicrobiota bacterium]